MAKKTLEQVIADFQEIWGDRYDYSEVEYVNTNTKVKIICRDHGEFWLYPYQHLAKTKKKAAGCYRCGREAAGVRTANALRSDTPTFIIKAKAIFGELYDYSKVEYVHSHQKVIIGCNLHGDFYMAPGRHLERQGCSMCSSQKSNAEGLWLDSLGLPRDQASRNIDLRINGRKCIIDGYDPVTNTVYEFHGDFWHGNPRIYSSNNIHPMGRGRTFGEMYQQTIEKEELIRSAGYNLITVWESDWKKGLQPDPNFSIV